MLQAKIDSELLLMSNQTITTNTNGTTVIDLKKIVDAQPAPQMFQLSVDVGAATLTANTYTIIAQCAIDNAFSNLTHESRIVISTGNGFTAENLYVAGFSPNARYVRLRVEVSGTSPSIVIRKAWLSGSM